ncbi:hypothetical protein WH47_05127 [Habropoda laboriosa]|uniref:Uncharacterized protein n=2 Tax=Habropoda laboriosa TaxID=597456 RepID=A0A0L7QSB3_9HYME|nr:hypothetical protein WH47_05127 [Habropoda laboriosa]
MQNLENCTAIEKIVRRTDVDINNSNKDTSISFYSSLDISKIKCEELFNDNDKSSFSSVSHRIHNLAPIKEKSEDGEDKCTDLCYHGCKNGCSATVPAPQQVSEKVFKENWLQKLQEIKRRELKLRNKEIILQNREKALLKKEREIKILESVLRDKLKQIDSHFKENKHFDLFKIDTPETQKDILEPLIYVDPKGIHKEKSDTNDNLNRKLDNVEVNKLYVPTENNQVSSHNQTEQLHKHTNDIQNFIHTDIQYKDLYQEKTSIESSCSSVDNLPVGKKIKQRSNIRNSTTSKTFYLKSTCDNNNKTRKPCKIYYDDLDTTLSADIGDSSFVQTSQKFNPELYKRPCAFKRSASERHVKYINNENNANLEAQHVSNHNEEFQTPIGIEQEKVFKRVTKNISVSQDKDTKFQHYGLIDQNVGTVNNICKVENEKRYSYLNLETSNKLCSCQKITKDLKNRPVSWNEQTNEWLQKKRKAYSMTIKKVHIGNKENIELHAKTNDKFEKVVKKRDMKNKLLTIFR